jgi:(p)ppGpp synthase/HD superfamily hydrolase
MGEARRPNNYEAIQVYFTKPGQPGDFLVTIATEEMNRVNRLGIAAQMLDDAWQRKSFDWLGRLVNIIQDAYSIEVARALVAEAGQTMRINQEEVDLPPGATALDYAFIKYPELALKADKVKVNNREVGLREVLKEGDQVQIIFDIRQHIKPAWLSCVRTIRAAEVIKKHLSQLSVEQQIEQGVAAINEVAELNYLSWADIEKTSELAAFIKARPELNLPKAAALPQAIGAGQINSQEIIKAFIEYYSRVLQERIADGQKHKRLISVRVTVPDIKKTLSQVADRISEFNINIGAALSVPIKVGADQAILLFDLPIFSSIQKAQVLNMLRKYPKSKGVKCRQIREAELARHVQMMLRYAATVQRN